MRADLVLDITFHCDLRFQRSLPRSEACSMSFLTTPYLVYWECVVPSNDKFRLGTKYDFVYC